MSFIYLFIYQSVVRQKSPTASQKDGCWHSSRCCQVHKHITVMPCTSYLQIKVDLFNERSTDLGNSFAFFNKTYRIMDIWTVGASDFDFKNPAYGRRWISRHVQKVAPIGKLSQILKGKINIRLFLFNLGGFRPLPCPITMYTPLRLVNTILKGINRVICISTTRGHQFKLNLKQRCLLVMQVPSTHKRLCVVSNCTLTHSFDPRAQLDSRHFQLKQNHLFT